MVLALGGSYMSHKQGLDLGTYVRAQRDQPKGHHGFRLTSTLLCAVQRGTGAIRSDRLSALSLDSADQRPGMFW